MSPAAETAPQTESLPPPAPPPRRSLPLGVAILSILVGIYGFLVFLTGLLLFVSVSVPYLSRLKPYGFGLGHLELDAVVTIFGLILIGIAVALWRLRLWALVLALLFLLYEIITFGIAGSYESIGFILAIIVFLYLIAVNRHFR